MAQRRTVRSAAGCLATGVALALAVVAPAAHAASPDSEAPPNAAAAWLPPEAWVYNHWLPYDEERLYSTLHITRSDLWQQLRDDHRTLGQLAARHGWKSPAKLAAKLVQPWEGKISAVRVRALRKRAERTITQGHLAQHLFFHSLHQFAIPSAAPDIFGVTDVQFRALRRTELSPLQIGRLHGFSPGEMQARALAVLRERVRAGVQGGAMTARQGDILLRRQVTQLPRWLDQARYNGPPPTHGGQLVAAPTDYASNPAISADGRHVVYESYRQKLPLALQLGEIAVLRRDVDAATTTVVSGANPAGATGNRPSSAYNPSVSGDGQHVFYESSAGNQNFAKRYGRIGVLLCDLSGDGHADRVDEPQPGEQASQSAYNPVVSADGRSLAYEAVRDDRTGVFVRAVAGGAPRPAVLGLAAGSGGGRYADPYEPSVSGDGSRVAYTLTTGRVGAPQAATSSVSVSDLATGRSILVSRADGPAGAPADAFSSDASISVDGRFVAFTSTAGNLGRSGRRARVYLRDLDLGRTTLVYEGSGTPLDPVVSSGGSVVAFTVVAPGGGSRVVAWRAGARALQVASRADGSAGAIAGGVSEDPSISADGRRIAFSSTARNLVAGSRPPARAVYLRDLATGHTTLISDTKAAYTVKAG